jgi:hypothetical protein
MSDLGQTETLGRVPDWSVRPLIADIQRAVRQVRFVPIATIERTCEEVRFVPQERTHAPQQTEPLFDHFVGSDKQGRRHTPAEWTAFGLGEYRPASFAFQFLCKMIASDRLGDGR